MNVACKVCHGSVWIEFEAGRSAPITANCRKCGQLYEAICRGPARSATEDLFSQARELARVHGVGVAAATSVLLGILTLDEVRRPFDTRALAPVGPRPLGWAASLGEQDDGEAGLAARHSLPLDLAREVSEKRMSLLEAMRARNARQLVPVQIRLGRPARGPLWWLAAAAIGAVALLLLARIGAEREAQRVTTTARVESADVVTDGLGRLVQIRAADPRSVLEAFCVSFDTERRLRPLGLVPSVLHGERLRLGLFRDPAEPGDLRVIEIREDRGTRHWVAGDGQNPLAPRAAPDEAVAAVHRSDSGARQKN